MLQNHFDWTVFRLGLWSLLFGSPILICRELNTMKRSDLKLNDKIVSLWNFLLSVSKTPYYNLIVSWLFRIDRLNWVSCLVVSRSYCSLSVSWELRLNFQFFFIRSNLTRRAKSLQQIQPKLNEEVMVAFTSSSVFLTQVAYATKMHVSISIKRRNMITPWKELGEAN